MMIDCILNRPLYFYRKDIIDDIIDDILYLVSSSQAEQQAEAAQAQAAAVAAAAQSIERKRRKPQVPKGELTVAEEITRISRNIPRCGVAMGHMGKSSK
jgi:hypothetical protein